LCKSPKSILPECSSLEGCPDPSSPTGYSPTSPTSPSPEVLPPFITDSPESLSSQGNVKTNSYPIDALAAEKTGELEHGIDTSLCPVTDHLGSMEDEDFWTQASADVIEPQLANVVELGDGSASGSRQVDADTGVCRSEPTVTTAKKQATLFSFMAVKPSLVSPPSSKRRPTSPKATRLRVGRRRRAGQNSASDAVESEVNSGKRPGRTSRKTCPFYKWMPGKPQFTYLV
jgi:hypothetical protein